MSHKAINDYYKELEKAQRFGGTKNEQSLKRPFINLLEKYFEPKNLYPVDELTLKNNKRPDGTIRDAFQIDWGHWENKDSKDDLTKEIEHKFNIGYPDFNILFENTKEIILYQNAQKVMQGNMQDADFLHQILSQFVNFIIPEVKEFEKAIEDFKNDIPEIVEILRNMIANQAKTNQKFKVARNQFLQVCKESINNEVSLFDVREMLIQHILTHEIFTTIFNDADFHRENNIAKELQKVIDTFFSGALKRNTLASIDTYYEVIKRKASHIKSHNEKQKFLKIVYENFYKAYNPKGADKLGIVYTPNEIVKFMVESTDILLEQHFNKNLSDKNVEILDPATGTGTFITEIIDYIPNQYLKYKYQNEIHANELAILPYYIANLNIEFTYQSKVNKYVPFENICWVDTLDNIGFSFKGKQIGFEGFGLSAENLERIKRQNQKKISVIIGNPPYNANQLNENDNNKNREYPQIDKRIKETYVKESTAQKSKVYDMYARFYRWASDRMNQDGIIAMITNNSFLNARTFDGFRKQLQKEFDYIYIVDLGGNIRELSGKDGIFLGEKHTIFGLGAMVGIAMMFLIKKKKEQKKDAQISYIHTCDIRATRKEKFDFLNQNKINEIAFEKITPDKKNNWLNITDNDFEELTPVCSKETKFAKSKKDEKAIFKLYSNGVVTNRDEWVYDFSKKQLIEKMKFFYDEYNHEVVRWKKWKKDNNYINDKKENNSIVDNFLHKRNKIKWSGRLKRDKLRKEKEGVLSKKDISKTLYRPFTLKFLCDAYIPIDVRGDLIHIFHNPSTQKYFKNTVISFNGVNDKVWNCIGFKYLVDLNFLYGGVKCLPLYRYTSEGERIDNITDWGLEQFQNFFKKKTVTKEKIFYYVYAVLHNPAYREKYKINLKRDFPCIPFYKDFDKWVNFGEALMELHLNYETVKPYDLQVVSLKDEKMSKVKLKIDKSTNDILIDENTTLKNVPAVAFDYKLGNRSAIEWILDQYKEKKPKDKTIAEKFNTYRFADYKKEVIELIKKVCTVSIETMKIIEEMKKEK